jgi:phosphoribosyl 1,2-cyclic phosphodiesterase
MATLKTLSSGSHGNCYILECGNEQLLIELGISWKDILRGLNFDLSRIVCCLVSHRHSDHLNVSAITNAIKCGLSVYSCIDVNSIYPQVKVLEKGLKMRVGGFKIQAIPLFHSVECYGYIIEHEDCGKIIFATDTYQIPYRFKNARHFFVESNNDFDLMVDNLCDNEFSRSHNNDHMELSDTIEFLKENYSVDMQSVTLIHLSQTNIDAKKAVQRVKDELGFANVEFAQSGQEIELLKSEF